MNRACPQNEVGRLSYMMATRTGLLSLEAEKVSALMEILTTFGSSTSSQMPGFATIVAKFPLSLLFHHQRQCRGV